MNEESFKRVLYLIFKVLISSNGFLSQLEIFKEVRILLDKSFNIKETDLSVKLSQGKTEDFKDILNFILTILCELKLVTQKLERKSFYFKWNNIKHFYSSYSDFLTKNNEYETSESIEHKAQIFTRNLITFLYKNQNGINEKEINNIMNKCGLDGQFRYVEKIFFILTFIKFIDKIGGGIVNKENQTQKFTLIKVDSPLPNLDGLNPNNNNDNPSNPNNNLDMISNGNNLILNSTNNYNYNSSLTNNSSSDIILYKINHTFINDNTLSKDIDDTVLQGFSNEFKNMILNKGSELNEKVIPENELIEEINTNSNIYNKSRTSFIQNNDCFLQNDCNSSMKKIKNHNNVDSSTELNENYLKSVKSQIQVQNNGQNNKIEGEEKSDKLSQFRMNIEMFNKEYSDVGFAMLRGANWVYYIKKLHCIIGRKPIKYNKPGNPVNTVWEVDVDLYPSKKISKQHALIVYNFIDKCFEIKNLSKKFPIKVNGEFMNYNEETPLRNKSVINIGNQEFYFILPK